VLNGIIIAFHLIVSLLLIVLILLHAGRGSGMSDMFGGGMGPMKTSTVMERNLDRITVATGLLFGLTTLLLTWRLR
jgi:preprotein translocase subunit SecG